MNKQITIPFQVTLWDLKPYDEAPNSPTLSRGTVKKTFDGELKGKSTGEILMYSAADNSATYTILDEPHLQTFYDKCGFVNTRAGLIKLSEVFEQKACPPLRRPSVSAG